MKDRFYLLGNRIDCFPDYAALYQRLLASRHKNGLNRYITVNNVHTMMEGFWDDSYRAIINQSYLSIPDGKPLQIMGRLKGSKTVTRLFGPTVMERFIDWGQKDGVKHFFFGSSEENLQKLRAAINLKYPDANIAGTLSPPFQPMEQWDNELYIQLIRKAQPDFIWIGLGAPKQERWMFQNAGKINSGVMFGIGAGFDYLAGNTQHAPEWMKNLSLEWLYRLTQEPGRLWKRYLTTIPPFLVLASLELAGITFRKEDKGVIVEKK
jgi:N-acetylglucosaminyldiphosphoundecaprenol N-acetyl-beta-D-mannosaminyltransferase